MNGRLPFLPLDTGVRVVPHLTLSLLFVIAACGGKSEEVGPQVLTFDAGGDTGVEDSGTGGVERIDNDGDGYTDDVDCADDDETINPSASETCDGVDNNCDGVIDEGLLQLRLHLHEPAELIV